MAEANVVGPVQEYEALRSELLDSRKYVFERPLLIVTLGVGGMTALPGEYRVLLPPLVASLVLFNFWFTVNRLLSAARIVAYIQLVLEEGRAGPWFGWETSLREYRRWVRRDPAGRKRLIDAQLDRDTIPDALMYYGPIYVLHLGAALFTLVCSVAAASTGSWLALACLVVCAACDLVFVRIAYRRRPALMRTIVERNRAIWRQVLAGMAARPAMAPSVTARGSG